MQCGEQGDTQYAEAETSGVRAFEYQAVTKVSQGIGGLGAAADELVEPLQWAGQSKAQADGGKCHGN
jgi:hypothetical protein